MAIQLQKLERVDGRTRIVPTARSSDAI